MAKGHRSQIKRERNANKDTRPSAKLSYARVSVTKACFVLDAIRGKDLETALAVVTYNPRYASSLVKKLLESAAANAENNNGMKRENLYVAECYANKGPTMKRVRPRAQGRAYRIEKRMSHITVVLDERKYHVGMSESEWILDTSIYMTLGSEMDDAIHLVVLYQLQHQVEITDITLYESIVRLVLDVLEVSQVACVCQLVEVDDVILRIFVHEKSYYM